jgi:putative molybdopterin biosynthesis protein
MPHDARVKSRGVHLQYRFEAEPQQGAEVHNPLFDLLSAVRAHGSIQHAARALGASYRHVWGALKHWQEVIGEPLVTWTQGQPARLTPFAERLLWAEARARVRLVPHIEALRAELERVLAEALEGEQAALAVVASHDQALPLLRSQAAAAGLHLELKFAGSLDALRALAEGRCSIAGFHVPPLADAANPFARGLKPLLQPGQHKLIGCTRRRQGLMVAPGNPLALRTIADIARPGVRFVQRQAGSGTRLLTDHLLARAGIAEAPAAATEDSHLAVAAAVASGLGDAGLGIAAAAAAFGLEFVPLIDEDYYLVCRAAELDGAAVQTLRSVLAAPAWAAVLATLPGYAAPHAGDVLSLTRALPWWRFASPKGSRQSVPVKRSASRKARGAAVSK